MIRPRAHARVAPSLGIGFALAASLAATPAQALDLDWAGQFRAEANWVRNYANAAPGADEGYAIRSGGNTSAHFQTLFMRLMPKVTVDDNVYLNSELWLGSPTLGLFGDSVPYTLDRRQYYSTFSRGADVSAQRLWVDVITDFGTVQVGRAPLHWGLGLLWNSGDGLWDRYQSTGDTVRLIAKFGSFSFIPAYTKYSTGLGIGGACLDPAATPACNTVGSNGSLTDYSLGFRFENPDDDFEAGLNFIRRLAGAEQTQYPVFGGTGGFAYNTFDLYAKKRLGKFSFGAEVPIVSGRIGGASYSATAAALETEFKPSDRWELGLRAGRAPGQPSQATNAVADYRAFYFHPNYRLGLILFNYQLANFAGPVTQNPSGAAVADSALLSPYDNPISNATYLSATGALKAGKWRFHSTWTFAQADQAATGGGFYWNTWSRQLAADGGQAQSKSLGWEMDYGATLQWDERFQLGLDFGVFFPGAFFEFGAGDGPLAARRVVAGLLRAGVSF
jgi:hypothetical protein